MVFSPWMRPSTPWPNMYVSDFVKTYNIGYPVGFSSPEERDGVHGLLNVMERYSVPQIIWIDRKGNIRSQTKPQEDDATLYSEGLLAQHDRDAP